MNFVNDKSIVLKILRIVFPIWLTFILFVVSIFLVFVPTLKKNLMTQKKEAIKNLVDSSCGIFSEYHKKVEQGELDIEDAKQRAINQLKNLRYGTEGKDYFWINDMHPFMVMHPYRPDLEGRDLTLFQDAEGNYPFMAMVETVMGNGSGYVNYYWQWKDTPQKIVPKISYVKGFAPWGWIVGTGIYTQDVKLEIEAILSDLSIISIVILLIILGISFYLTLQTIWIENDRSISVRQLKKSEELHRKFIDNAPIAMYTVNLKGEFTYINKKFELITGYKNEEWLDKNYGPIVHPDDLGIVENKMMLRLEGKGTTDPYVIRIFNSNGNTIWIKIHSESIFKEKGESRELIGIQSFVEDITFQKEAETSLKFSESRLKAILEANPDPMVVYDLVGHPDYLNPAFTNVFGWTLNELKNKKIPFVPKDQKQITSKKINEIFQHGNPLTFETKRYTKDGRCLDILLSAAVNKNDDNIPIGMVVNLTDVTERKALEAHYKQAHKMESIGTLTAGIAHDFNNILNVILGHSELAMGDIPDSMQAYRNLKRIRKAGFKAADIVRQLLSFSRKTEQNFKVLKLSLIINDSLQLLRSLIPANIEIKKNFFAENQMILANQVQINQIIMNLCINAAQEMEKSGGLLEISIEDHFVDAINLNDPRDLKEGPYVKLTVTDTGSGIEPQYIDRIFDPYFTTKGVGEGSGMGLSVVHGIVKAHKGIIEVSSNPRQGAKFEIFFPVTEEKPSIEKRKNDKVFYGHEKILFVDDDKAIGEVTKESLERIGYKVEACFDPLKAIELFKLKPEDFDLVITDMTMPNLTGDKLAKELLKIKPDIPIIICTGYSSLLNEKKAKQIGAADLLMKPITISKLSKTIRKILG